MVNDRACGSITVEMLTRSRLHDTLPNLKSTVAVGIGPPLDAYSMPQQRTSDWNLFEAGICNAN